MDNCLDVTGAGCLMLGFCLYSLGPNIVVGLIGSAGYGSLTVKDKVKLAWMEHKNEKPADISDLREQKEHHYKMGESHL